MQRTTKEEAGALLATAPGVATNSVKGAGSVVDHTTNPSAYSAFLESKRIAAMPVGFDLPDDAMHPSLFPFQRDIVRWSVRRGRAALFCDCGLGKTRMQLEWARAVVDHTGRDVLILAPLAVAAQTAREGAAIDLPVTVCRDGGDVRPGVNITNYERLHHFTPERFAGIVLDESSILKGFNGATRKAITDFAETIYYRLACTATPAPNDLIELTNHAEFLGIMSGKEIIALFFTQDGNTTHQWRLKGHAREDFWTWMASWSVAVRAPSDLGYADGAFVLPALRMCPHVVPSKVTTGTLFAIDALTLQERQQARRDSLDERVQRTAALVNASDEQWIVWCDLNAESTALTKAISDAVEVTGSDTPEHKEQAVLDFVDGKTRVLVSKPSIMGFGVNLQNCAHMAFVGLSDSYEQQYQAIRRCWRFGQTRPVDVHVITAEAEGAVVKNIQRKERQAKTMMDQIVKHIHHELAGAASAREEMTYQEDVATGEDWTLYLGDSIRRMDEIPDNSIGLAVFSPPFPGMYAYTNSAHDMGNSTSIDQLMEHFRFLIAPDKLYRVLMPGRSVAIHLTQAVAFKGVDGYIGLKDFRGKVIAEMEAAGWIYYGEVTIDKNPQLKAIRTKDRGLLFKTLATDSSHMHMALADYLLQFRKPGENPQPIRAGISEKYDNEKGWITPEEWIEWAAPVWYRADAGVPGGIRETDVLNVQQARETDDERHLAPLQLGVIERAVKLWSAPGDTVLDPFNGIGSTGYVSLKLHRKYVGIELKGSYWKSAIVNLNRAIRERTQEELPLFAGLETA
jgi:DNA modification methylase